MHAEQFRRLIRGAATTQTSRSAARGVATRRDGTRRDAPGRDARAEGTQLAQAPETSGWLWQFKSCERRRRCDAERPYRAAYTRRAVESRRSRAGIISGKFQTGSRGLAPAEAAEKA